MPLLEISDLVVARDPVTAERLPVRREDVVAELLAAGDRRGARIAAAMPAVDGVLDPLAVDRRLVTVHTELQRLSEELRIGDRRKIDADGAIAIVRTDLAGDFQRQPGLPNPARTCQGDQPRSVAQPGDQSIQFLRATNPDGAITGRMGMLMYIYQGIGQVPPPVVAVPEAP